MGQRTIKVEGGIKTANQMTVRWGDYVGLSGWPQCNHNVLKSDTL